MPSACSLVDWTSWENHLIWRSVNRNYLNKNPKWKKNKTRTVIKPGQQDNRASKRARTVLNSITYLCLESQEDKRMVPFSSVTQSCPTLCDPMDCSTPGFPVHHQLLEFTQTHFHWVGDAIQPSHPLSFPSPPALNLSQHQGLFKWVSSSHQVAKILEFQLQHQSFQWTPGLVSFRMDWLDLLAVQGILKSLLQHHSSKASILQHSAFLPVQLSHLYMTTGKTIALTRWIFVGKVMSLLFNMLSY